MRRRFLVANLFVCGLIASCALVTGCSSHRGRVHDRTVYVERDRGPYRRHVIVEDPRHHDRHSYDRHDDDRYYRH